MTFIDSVTLIVKAGNGGDGIVCFEKGIRGEKIPAGGNGGDGGSIFIVGKNELSSLNHIQQNQTIRAESGSNGQNNNCHGSNGADYIIYVPFGTKITEVNSKKILCFITPEHNMFCLQKGGRGGRGNKVFLSNDNKIPVSFELGRLTFEIKITISMQIIADVGVLGFPSVGKTTLLNKLTNNHFKVGNYDFTTLVPNIAVDNLHHDKNLKICDIPGIIKDSHKNKGLGLYFLKHIILCKVLVFVCPIKNSFDDFVDSIEICTNELRLYNAILLKKPHIYLLNIFDKKIYDDLKPQIDLYMNKTNKKFISYNVMEANDFSRLNHEIDKLLMVNQDKFNLAKYYADENCKTIEISPIKNELLISKINDNEYDFKGSVIDYLISLTPPINDDNFQIIIKELKKLNHMPQLKKQGIKNNDIIVIGTNKFPFIYK